MARDYKHRAQTPRYGANQPRKRAAASPNMWRRWLLVAALIAAFVVFLNMLGSLVDVLVSDTADDAEAPQEQVVIQSLSITPPKALETKTEPKQEEAKPVVSEQEPKAAEPKEPEGPRYDFYTILPQAETVIPDYEIQSRVREELVGKTKATKYVMQAGSFREASEAERHKAKLAQLGIEAWLEKAKVNNVIWYRVKIGPYDNPSSVATIKGLLQKNGIGVIITEQSK